MKRKFALYQKYRPVTFKEIYGQEQNIQILKNSILMNKIQNGYIFCGQYGTGKTSLARIFAGAINCHNFKNNLDVIDHCAACTAITKGHPDIIEIDAASNSGIDSIRALREETQIAPLELNKKVYIIDEAHMLSSAAWDGMLKILEDPALRVIFIFATTNVNKIPKTINSRCIELKFNKLGKNSMTNWLEQIVKKEKIPYHKKALEIIINAANGSFRDALTLLDKKILLTKNEKLTEELAAIITGAPPVEKIMKWIELLLHKQINEGYRMMSEFLKADVNPVAVAELAVFCLSELLNKNISTGKIDKYVSLLNVFYNFLRDQKSFYNPHISLRILIMKYLTENKGKEQLFSDQKLPSVNNDEINNTNEDTDIQNKDFHISTKKAMKIEEEIEQRIARKQETTQSEESVINEDIIETSDEIEQTIDITDDSIDLNFSDELYDTNLMHIKEEKKASEEKTLLSDKISKVTHFVWEVVEMNANKPELLFPVSWNITAENLIALLYIAIPNDSKDFVNVENTWHKLEEMIENDEGLPFSAFLYDGSLVAMTNDTIFLTYSTPIRALLLNRICRTEEFLNFMKKVFGKEYWVISMPKAEWVNLRTDYFEIQKANGTSLSTFSMPNHPSIIKKQYRPAKKAYEELIRKLERDPLLKDYKIEIKK